VRITNTVVKDAKKLSKFKSGELPFSKSTVSVDRFNFILKAKSSSPKRVKTRIKTNSRIEKVAISLRVRAIVSRSSSRRFQLFASLKILKRRNPLKAVITLV